jgi:tRNA threonylcarbamoyl adenosine modification protein (Sua5/YciO/YrdC/YwlC family)
MLIEINARTPEPRKIRRAVDALERGEIIAYPTDTAYGLGCDLLHKRAVERLYQLKGMSPSQPLSFICPDLRSVSQYAVMHDWVFRILKAFLPGPYTFIVEATREVPRVVQSKRKTVGVRIPDNAVCLALVQELGRPVISTTATRRGEPPEPDPAAIDDEFPGLALILDAGPGSTEVTSVIDLTTGNTPTIVREGAGDVSAFRDGVVY